MGKCLSDQEMKVFEINDDDDDSKSFVTQFQLTQRRKICEHTSIKIYCFRFSCLQFWKSINHRLPLFSIHNVV